jgi:hypothetical protein
MTRFAYRVSSLVAVVLLGSCTYPDAGKAASECEAVTTKALPNDGLDAARFDQQSRYARQCMRSKGFSAIAGDARCSAVAVEGISIDPSCFQPMPSLLRLPWRPVLILRLDFPGHMLDAVGAGRMVYDSHRNRCRRPRCREAAP